VPFRPQRAAASIAYALGNRSAGDVLVILPHDQQAAEAVVAAAARAAGGRGATFLYRGVRHGLEYADLFEVSDPYLHDYAALDAFARAAMLSSKHVPNRRYVYVRGNLPREIVGEVWRTIGPKETLVALEDKDVLPPMAVDRVHRHHADGTTVLHLFTNRLRRASDAAQPIGAAKAG
jgi:hypothetical protein